MILDAVLTYAPPLAHEKLSVAPVAADERPTEPPQILGVDAAGPMFSGDIAAYLRHRSSLDPELVLEPKAIGPGQLRRA